MPITIDVLSDRAEAALSLINLTMGQHQREISHLVTQRPKRLSTDVHDAKHSLRQSTIARVASITEAFCVDRLMAMAYRELEPEKSVVRRAIFDDALKGATGTWSSIRGAFAEWHGVKPNWKPLEGVQEVRNAIAHGLGRLTHRQISNRTATVQRIRQIGLDVDSDDRLIVADGDVLGVSRVCEQLIRDVDERTRGGRPLPG